MSKANREKGWTRSKATSERVVSFVGRRSMLLLLRSSRLLLLVQPHLHYPPPFLLKILLPRQVHGAYVVRGHALALIHDQAYEGTDDDGKTVLVNGGQLIA